MKDNFFLTQRTTSILEINKNISLIRFNNLLLCHEVKTIYSKALDRQAQVIELQVSH